MKISLKDRHLLITGSSSGLGFSLAKEAIKRGAFLTLCSRRTDVYEGFNENRTLIVKTDVTDPLSVKNALEQGIKKFNKLDVVIANAGRSMWAKFSDLSDPEEILDLMRLNYMGVVNALFYSLPYLRNGGAFVAISSIQGEVPAPYHSGYAASKHAINGFLESVAMEETDVQFMIAAPGWISGTELRSKALKSEKMGAISVRGTHKKAVSAHDAAVQILDALENGKKICYIPRHLRFIPIFRKICRKTMDARILKRVSAELAKNQ